MLGVGGWEGGMAGVAEVLNCPPTKPPVVAHPRSHEDSTAGKEESQTMTKRAHESAKAADAKANVVANSAGGLA